MEDGGLSIMDLPHARGDGESFLQFDVWVGRGQGWRDLGAHAASGAPRSLAAEKVLRACKVR
jgi:hypothetical protein